MYILRSCLTVIACFNLFIGQAQDSILHLTGKLIVSVKKGTMDGNFTLAGIPRIEDYLIRINSGLNIRHFKNVSGGNFLYYDRSISAMEIMA